MTARIARDVAYDVVRAVRTDDAYANLLLPRALQRAGMSAADAALATELTYGTLRRQGTYDAVIAAAADRPVARIDADVLDALRIGTHQLLSTRVASYAAVNETVAQVRRLHGARAGGFANAVLRRVSRDTPGDWMTRILQDARSDDERLSLRTAHPVWIIRALRRALRAEGREGELDALLAADNAAPHVTLAALPGLPALPSGLPRTPYSPLGYRAPAGDPEPLLAASGGALRVQDEGSQLAALALSRAEPARPGERWLDLCAGPGGKTAVLAAEARAAGAVLQANEPVPARAGLVRRALAGVDPDVEVSEQDGRRVGDAPAAYDRVLVDAPCTGLGALRRRPEARWRKSAADVAALSRLQGELLSAAIRATRPGGLIGYVTCSPHLSETVDVVADALDAGGVTPVDARAVLQRVSRTPMDLPTPADGSATAQLWPHRHGTDAMFIALLRRS